jgi:septal ring factor EnvC (AmiA/AmiB activator)
MTENLQWIIGLVAGTLIGFFSWILFVTRRQERAAIHNLKDDAEQQKKIIALEKDVEHIGEKTKNMLSKIDNLAEQFNILNASIVKMIMETKGNQDELIKVEKKVDNIDARIEIMQNSMSEYILRNKS